MVCLAPTRTRFQKSPTSPPELQIALYFLMVASTTQPSGCEMRWTCQSLRKILLAIRSLEGGSRKSKSTYPQFWILMSSMTVPISEVFTLPPRYETSLGLSLPSTQMHLSTKDSSRSLSSSHPSTVNPWLVGRAVEARGGRVTRSEKVARRGGNEMIREDGGGGRGGETRGLCGG